MGLFKEDLAKAYILFQRRQNGEEPSQDEKEKAEEIIKQIPFLITKGTGAGLSQDSIHLESVGTQYFPPISDGAMSAIKNWCKRWCEDNGFGKNDIDIHLLGHGQKTVSEFSWEDPDWKIRITWKKIMKKIKREVKKKQ